ncbi:Acyl-protein thioesterase 1 [Trichinella pseudospiralis]|uniref:palmitoyl-protein hydrolase n=1 Tax=Trichinella pseudospiralis TaxID=6337 RepID=A0A0V1J2M4_TRIPS|nr:Acyl-protein thioesterase 1 [Trichinella pseudospiralis]
MALKISNKTPGILDVTISKGKNEINLATFALLFSEVVRYSQSRVTTISELQAKLTSYGKIVGSKLVDLIFFRDKGYKREVKLLGILLFIKTTLFKSIFGKEADKLERNNYIIEREPLVNTFISVPKDKGNLNCASFTGGIIEAVLNLNNFPCKVTTVWHNGTTYVIEFEESNYLKKYGYLQNDADVHQRSEALKRFQRHASLPITGIVNSETMYYMSLPRCSLKDVDEEDFSSDFISKLKRRKRFANLTYIISRYTNRLPKDNVNNTIRRAFKVWEEKSPLRFRQISKRPANIDIAFLQQNHGDGEPFDGQGGILAHAFFPRYGGDVHFDDDEYWTPEPNSGVDLYAVAAHEIGHSLGLKHSKNRNALMAPFYQTYSNSGIHLHNDDIQALQYLYGTEEAAEFNISSDVPDYSWPNVEVSVNMGGKNNSDSNQFEKVNICNNPVLDTITVIGNGSTYAFQGKWYWRLNQLSYDKEYPRKISDDWDGLADDLDAAVGDNKGNTYFFKDDLYWLYNADGKRISGYPKRISVGLVDLPDNLDAAMIWSYDQQPYFFKGKFYWKYSRWGMHNIWPRLITAISPNLPDRIDAAFQWTNGENYIFAGPYYYRISGWRSMKRNMDAPCVISATGTHTASVIFLHGLGDTGFGWSPLFQKQFQFPHIKFICPHAPIMPVSLNSGMRMHSWFDIVGIGMNAAEDEDGIKHSAKQVQNLIEEEMRNGIPSHRIILGGFSQGGALALYSSLTFNKRLAGIMSLSCWLPLHRQFSLDNISINKITPILQCHGEDDQLVSREVGQATAELLKQLCSSHKVIFYPGMSHTYCAQELDDMKHFINSNLPPA